MRVHVTDNNEIKDRVRMALIDNDWYCPSVADSKGKPEYKCMCQDFINNTPVGQSCHCGLYIKDE